jgi:hypothetical protein
MTHPGIIPDSSRRMLLKMHQTSLIHPDLNPYVSGMFNNNNNNNNNNRAPWPTSIQQQRTVAYKRKYEYELSLSKLILLQYWASV